MFLRSIFGGTYLFYMEEHVRINKNVKKKYFSFFCGFSIFSRPRKYQLLRQNINFSEILHNLGPVRLQMHLSPSSGGVGWANGYCGILIATRTQRLASFWGPGKPGNTISKVQGKNYTFFLLVFREKGYIATQLRESVVQRLYIFKNNSI